jgi:hypothetical protein
MMMSLTNLGEPIAAVCLEGDSGRSFSCGSVKKEIPPRSLRKDEDREEVGSSEQRSEWVHSQRKDLFGKGMTRLPWE